MIRDIGACLLVYSGYVTSRCGKEGVGACIECCAFVNCADNTTLFIGFLTSYRYWLVL